MKMFFTALALTAFALQPAIADWVIVQKSTSDGQSQEATLRIKDENARMDVGDQMSILLNGASSGDIVLLMHGQKSLMRMNSETLKGTMAMAAKMLGGLDKGPPAKPQATGQTEQVGSYNTEIYTWSGAMGSGKYWVAKDFPHAKELNELQDKLMKAMGNPTAALAPAATDFPGMIIKSEMTVMGKTVTTETVSAKQEPVAEAVFTLPADYQEMKMPALPGLPGN